MSGERTLGKEEIYFTSWWRWAWEQASGQTPNRVQEARLHSWHCRVDSSTVCLCKKKAWASCDLLSVAKCSDTTTTSKRVPTMGSALETSLKREGVKDNYVPHCQERLWPSGCEPREKHGFCQPWGNEAIPQQVLLSLYLSKNSSGSQALGSGPAASLLPQGGFSERKPSHVHPGRLMSSDPCGRRCAWAAWGSHWYWHVGRTSSWAGSAHWAHEIAICHTLSLWLWEAGAGAVLAALGLAGIRLELDSWAGQPGQGRQGLEVHPCMPPLPSVLRTANTEPHPPSVLTCLLFPIPFVSILSGRDWEHKSVQIRISYCRIRSLSRGSSKCKKGCWEAGEEKGK